MINDWKKWLKCAGIRALKTAAQAVVTLIGADAVNFFTVDWKQAAGIALGMAALSMLTSLAGLPECSASEG